MAKQKLAQRCGAYPFYRKFRWGAHAQQPHRRRAPLPSGKLMVIAMINIGKVVILTFDCKTNCPLQAVFVGYLDTIENVVLIYIPFAALATWLIQTVVRSTKCRSKKKRRLS